MKGIRITAFPSWARIAAAALALAALLSAQFGNAPAAYAAGPGAVVAWGSNSSGQAAIPADLTGVTAIAAGLRHNLALKADGTVVAWGDNSYGQVDVPPGLSDPGSSELVAIAAGSVHNLVLKHDGTVVAWGGNSLSQATVPAGLGGVVAVAAGTSRSLALKADGTVVAWGSNSFGEATAPAGLSGVVAVSAGYLHSLALKADGTVVAWGFDLGGMASVPAGLADVVAVDAGDLHNLALKRDGTVVAWGNDTLGQASVPAGLSGAVAIAAGSFHSLALVSQGPADTSAPSAASALSPAANGSGWNNTDVTVNWNWTDSGGSGIDEANCTQRTDVSGGGVFSLVATCRDLAGNEATASVEVRIDRTPPLLGACPAGGPFGSGSGPQPVGPISVDASISGLSASASTLSSMVDTSTAGSVDVTFTAVDNAGNSATRTCSYAVVDAPPVCDGRHATVTIRLDADPDSERDMRLWGAYGSVLLDDPAGDDGDSVGSSITYDQVLPGTHNFALAIPFAWWRGGVSCDPAAQCSYSAQQNSVAVTVQACDNVTATFTALRKGSLLVTTFADGDGDGAQDGGETRLTGWWAELTYSDDAGSRHLVASNFSDGSGEWRVLNLVPGRTYTLCQKPQAGWDNTLPGPTSGVPVDARGWACYTFPLATAEAVEAAFGYRPAGAPAPTRTPVSGLGASGTVPEDAAFLFLPAIEQ